MPPIRFRIRTIMIGVAIIAVILIPLATIAALLRETSVGSGGSYLIIHNSSLRAYPHGTGSAELVFSTAIFIPIELVAMDVGLLSLIVATAVYLTRRWRKGRKSAK